MGVVSLVIPVDSFKNLCFLKGLSPSLCNNCTMNNVDLMKSELAIERTPLAWPIRKKAMDSLKESLSLEDAYITHVGECKYCGIILNQRCFFNGCPNCNVKDIKMLEGEQQ
jgi:hypothetical protein